MRYLLHTIDAIGDFVVTLPVQKCILDNDPSAEVFWLLWPSLVPILKHFPGVSGIFCRTPDMDLSQLFGSIKPDVLLNFNHRDPHIVPIAKRMGVPVRVARVRSLMQTLCATHRIWERRGNSGRHESQHSIGFLKHFGWSLPQSMPPPPKLALEPEEEAQGNADLRDIPAPRLGVVTRGSGGKAGAFPSEPWWDKMFDALKNAGWNPIILSPPDDCSLPPVDIRGLMARLKVCNAVLGISTGPSHLAAALEVPLLCLMGQRKKHGPHRWMPLGNRVEVLQYPGTEDDLGSGMDRLSAEAVLAQLEKLR
jgi:ADP-heptose:LPS heptosyltransferase